MQLVGADPAQAVILADDLIMGAVARRDPASESRALRVRGMAYQGLNDLDAALRDLERAVVAAEQAGDRQAAAEARMSLVSVLSERGEFRAALAASDRAAEDLTGLPAARLWVQRATCLCRLGQFSAGADELLRALPVLREHGDDVWEARALNNLGAARIYLGQLTEAAEDFRRAEELSLANGNPVYAALAGWNLGECAVRLGDVPLALAQFDSAESRFAAHGVPLAAVAYLDRAELLLSAGLYGEALANAERALDVTDGTHNTLWAEAHLVLARSAQASGDTARAADAARNAARLFQDQGRLSWAAVARYVLLCCETPESAPAGALADAISTADELAQAGWRAQELDARIIAARIATARGDTREGRDQLRLASSAKHTGTMDARARAWHAEALLRLASGDEVSAEQALRAGLDALDQHRAALGATELRVHTAVHGKDLAGLGVELALRRRSADEVLRWVERWRAGALRWRPVRPPEDATLAGLLTELRTVAAAEEQQRLDGDDPRQTARRRQALERQVISRTRRTAGAAPAGGHAGPLDVGMLTEALGDRGLVEYFTFHGELHAVTIVGSDVRVHQLGPIGDVQQDLDHLAFALRSLASAATHTGRRGARDLLRSCAAGVDDRLLGALLHHVGDTELVLVPSAALNNVPWAALPSCSGRPMSVAPSAALWLRGAVAGQAAAAKRVAIISGPGLASGDMEAKQLAASYPGAALLLGSEASVSAVLVALDGASVAHIAAHGTVRADNPFFSALHVADGPLTVFDLERLENPPELVVLPACQSGVTVARPGDEMLGLTAALLALGSRCLVACVAPVPDSGAQHVMTLLHDELRGGRSPANALAVAQRALRDSDDLDVVAAIATFACYGAG